jgi:hypothetical protein
VGKKKQAAESATSRGARPEVIVDFELEGGLLFVVLANVGSSSARAVKVRFEPEFHGLGGKKSIPRMRMFRALDLLAPQRRLRQLVDDFAAYTAREEPVAIEVALDYRDRDGQRFEERIRHDLRIYRELGEVRRLVAHQDL